MGRKSGISKTPALHTIADTVSRRLPKSISPKGHAIFDYLAVGIFALAGGLFWKTNKRAAVAALLCGGANLGLNLVTDYPGGIVKLVKFPDHKKVDLALAALTSTMPEIIGFYTGRRFFVLQSGAMTVSTNLTQFATQKDLRIKYPAHLWNL